MDVDNQIQRLQQMGYIQIDQRGINHIDQFIDCMLNTRSTGFAVNKKYYGVFQNHVFRTDDPNLSVDYVYKTVTGMTKQQCIVERQRWVEQYQKRYLENRKNIKEVIANWVRQGHEIIYEKYWNNWDTVVSYRAGSVYIGEELRDVLNIMSSLKQNIPYETIFDDFMKTRPDKEKYLVVKKILWLVGGEQFVGYLNSRIQILDDKQNETNKVNKVIFK